MLCPFICYCYCFFSHAFPVAFYVIGRSVFNHDVSCTYFPQWLIGHLSWLVRFVCACVFAVYKIFVYIRQT